MIIHTVEQFRDFARDFNWEVFSLDFETNSLEWFELSCDGMSFYNGKSSGYINLLNNPKRVELVYNVGNYLARAKTIIGHNLTFDIKVLAKLYGQNEVNKLLMRVQLIDTYLAAFLIDERETCKLKGVGSCCERFLKHQPDVYNEQLSHDSEQFYKYAEDDAVLTWDLWQVEKPILKEQNLETIFDIECKFIPVRVELELTGVCIDQSLLKELEYNLDTMKCELEEELLKSLESLPLKQQYLFEVPIEALGLTSHVKIKKLVKDKFGIELKSTNKKSIKEHIHVHPFFQLFLKYRATTTLLNTFITPCWGLIKPDGRIHPEYHIVNSGRDVATHPNLQNQAKENDLVPEINIRKMYIAPAGKKLLRIDYNGQELRLAAHNVNELNMLKAFENEWDVHLFVANKVLGLNIWDEYLCEKHPQYKEVKEYFDKERTKFKAVNFGIIYGKQPGSFAQEWNVPFWEAKKAVDGFFTMFPAIKEGIATWKKFQEENGYTVTWLGRRRRFNKPMSAYDFRAGFNHLEQGGGADMMKKAAGDVWRYKQTLSFSARIILLIHDEIIIEADEDKIESLIKPISNIMCNTLKLRCPVKVDSKVVRSYGD